MGTQLTTEKFIDKVRLVHPTYDWSLVDYKSSIIKVKFICPIHGIKEATPNSLLKGQGCYICGIKKRKHTKLPLSTEEFICKVNKVHMDYDWSLVDYKSSSIKIKVICLNHGVFEATPNSLLKGQGCPICKSSKGEKFISKWLQDNGYEFTPQKRFPTCKIKKELPFDFHINNTNILIEYDGEQHFKAVKSWGGEDALQELMKRDHFKTTWARANNYIIIRLDYLMSNQEKIDMLESIKKYNCLKIVKASYLN